MQHFPITFSKEEFDQLDLTDQIEKKAFDLLLTTFQKKMEYEKTKLSTHQELMHKLIERGLVEGTIDSESATKAIAQIIRSIFLSNIDRNWQQHLLHIDHLRAEVYMRSIGQKDPLMEFKHESFTLFDQYIKNLRIEVGEALFKFEITLPSTQEIHERLNQLQMQKEIEVSEADAKVQEKANRNALCPCGSGKKYKKCCGAITHNI